MTTTTVPQHTYRSVGWFTPFHLLATFQALDVITTAYVLLYLGNGSEGNPIARQLTNWGPVGLIVVLFLKMWIVVRLYNVNASPRRILIANIVYGAVLLNNFLVLAGTGSPILWAWHRLFG